MGGWALTAGLVLLVAMLATRGGPLGAAGWLVALPLRLGFWLLKEVWAGTRLVVLSFLALLTEEARRWLILATWGVVLWTLFWSAGRLHAPLTLRGVAAVATLLWLRLLLRTLRATLRGRFDRARQRAVFHRLEQLADDLPRQVEGIRDAAARGAQALPSVRPAPHPTERFSARIRERAADAVAGTTGEGGLAFEPVIAAPEVPAWMRRGAGEARKGFLRGWGRKR